MHVRVRADWADAFRTYSVKDWARYVVHYIISNLLYLLNTQGVLDQPVFTIWMDGNMSKEVVGQLTFGGINPKYYNGALVQMPTNNPVSFPCAACAAGKQRRKGLLHLFQPLEGDLRVPQWLFGSACAARGCWPVPGESGLCLRDARHFG